MARADSIEAVYKRVEQNVGSHLTNAAPEHDPEVWDRTIPAFNPHLDHAPEPEPVAVSPECAAQHFDVEEYLAQERSKDLLRFSTAGSVDDGKSTLIGRLLYDTQSVYDDQLSSIEGKGTTAPGVLDLALLTDGLRAEREQGITIDVAYRYFSTARRKFIIADTPGHEQYTRNMATGASTADVAIILIDARKGVLTQSRRHAFITALLGVKNIIVAVNKMDLVEYAESVFAEITQAFTEFFRAQDVAQIERINLHFVPVSALSGDNVVHGSTAMPWYTGQTLLELLESLPSLQLSPEAPFRMAVQRVVRPELDFRGFAGQIASGTIQCGDSISVLPSGKQTRVKRIVTFDGDLQRASAPSSITLTLEDEVDISRGDIIASSAMLPAVATSFLASLVWMDSNSLEPTKRYLLKQMSRIVPALVKQLHSVFDPTASTHAVEARNFTLTLNEIGRVSVEVLLPIVVDSYAKNRHTGSFVLIDPSSNLTVAAGMIESTDESVNGVEVNLRPVTADERQNRYGHIGAELLLTGSQALLSGFQRALFERGAFVITLPSGDLSAAATIIAAGALALSYRHASEASLRVSTPESTHLIQVTSDNMEQAIKAMLEGLRTQGVLLDRNTP